MRSGQNPKIRGWQSLPTLKESVLPPPPSSGSWSLPNRREHSPSSWLIPHYLTSGPPPDLSQPNRRGQSTRGCLIFESRRQIEGLGVVRCKQRQTMSACGRAVRGTGALDGGSPMSHVEFKKFPCPLSLFLLFPCRF